MTAPSDAAEVALGVGRDLRIVKVRHRYTTAGGPVDALAQVDLDIAGGELVCLLGPSGCGKTTLLQLIAGFLPPSEGGIFVGEQPVTAPGHDRGVVFQQPTSLYPWFTVRGNVELGPRLRRVPRGQRRARADTELTRVRLTEFADKRVYELSGGMQQRCQIARVLANDPDIMLMDEPFSALDALTREHLHDELRRIWHETGRTIVFVTHSVDEAVALASRVIVLSPRPGRVVHDQHLTFSASDRPLRELRADPDFVAVCAQLRTTIETTHAIA